MGNQRLERFRTTLKTRGMDGALVIGNVNRNYLTGFTGDESYIIVTGDTAIFITDSRYIEQAQNEVSGFEIREYNTALGIASYIRDFVRSLNIKRLGFEEGSMSCIMYHDIKESLQDVELIWLDGEIEKLRQIKDGLEIENITKAAEIADQAFSHMIGFIKHRMTEKEIGLELEFFMRSKGALALSFPSIVASGCRSSLPHGTATEKMVEEGEFLTLDFGCIYNGYCSDMTRTVVIGKATEKQKEIYSIVLEANEMALKSFGPGMTGKELDMIARKVIEDRGYGRYFGHGLGHGVGMEVHESPRISPKGEEPLKPGMVVTDEPGIYIPGFGGVRIEELVLITPEGHRVLSRSDKHLIEIA